MSKQAGGPWPEFIKRSTAADFVCDKEHPGAGAYDRKKHRNSIGTRITRAIKAGNLTIDAEGLLETAEFFSWAFERYPSLRNIPNLPRQATEAHLEASLPALSGGMFGVTIPSKREELEACYREAVCELQHSQKETQRLKDEAKQLEPYRLREEQRERDKAAWSERHSAKIKKGLEELHTDSD